MSYLPLVEMHMPLTLLTYPYLSNPCFSTISVSWKRLSGLKKQFPRRKIQKKRKKTKKSYNKHSIKD